MEEEQKLFQRKMEGVTFTSQSISLGCHIRPDGEILLSATTCFQDNPKPGETGIVIERLIECPLAKVCNNQVKCKAKKFADKGFCFLSPSDANKSPLIIYKSK